MSQENLKSDDFVLILEKWALKVKAPFLRTALLFSLTIFLVQWPLLYFTGLLEQFSINYLRYLILWTWPSIVSVVASLYFSKRLRNKAISAISKILPFTKEDRRDVVIARLRKTFSSNYSFVLPLFFSFLFAMPFQIYFLVINPWEYFWSELYQISYYGAMAFGIYSAIATWIFVFFILSLGYFALGVAYSIYKLKNEIGALSIEEIDSGALTPIGSLAICLASCFLFGVSVNLALIVVAPLEWWAILEICMFSISVLLLFFLPIYDLHSLIVTKKEAAVKELKSNWWLAAKKHDHVNTKLIAGIEERIEKIPTWPFDTKTLLELSGYVVVPFIIWVVSYLTI